MFILSKHAKKRCIERNITASQINQALTDGVCTPYDDAIIYKLDRLVVITNQCTVVTVFRDAKPNMKRVIRKAKRAYKKHVREWERFGRRRARKPRIKDATGMYSHEKSI